MSTTAKKIVWTRKEMVLETALHFEWQESDCDVIEHTDAHDEPCLIVMHIPTGRTSAEAGDGGRWHLDRTAYR